MIDATNRIGRIEPLEKSVEQRSNVLLTFAEYSDSPSRQFHRRSANKACHDILQILNNLPLKSSPFEWLLS